MNGTENPFPSDEEVHYMAELGAKLLEDEFGIVSASNPRDAEEDYRRLMLGQCLRDARLDNHWTVKFCATKLGAKPKELNTLEDGQFGAGEGARLRDYVHLLGLEELYGQWLAANTALAAKLNLPSPEPPATRPADWPVSRPFMVAPGQYRLTPAKRKAMETQLGTLKKLGAEFRKGLEPFSAGSPRETPPPEAAPAIYQFKITLLRLRPPVWRRFQVANDLTLGQFHYVVQTVMGWCDEHLHEFRLGEQCFGMTHDPMGGPLDTGDALDEDKYRLSQLGLRAKSRLEYQYDFGDSWEHQLLLEKVLPAKSGFVPVCLDGARACPPENSGGPWGYAEQVSILANPKDPQYEETAEWMGADFDPGEFDVEETNDALANLARIWKRRRSRR